MEQNIIENDAQRIAESLNDDVDALAGKTILITGAAGFLCAYLVDMLVELNRKILKQPIHIIALDNFLRGIPERLEHLNTDKNVEIEKYDVTKKYVTERNIDYIIHGASIASPVYYRKFPIETINVNVTGLKNMLDLAMKGAESVIFLSSSEIYGDPDPEFIPTNEEYRGYVSCTGPRACYDESKRLGETLCVGYSSQHNVPVKMVRPFNVYGPGQQLDDQRIVPDLLSAVINDKPIVLYSDGKATRSFCYASDFITGLLKVLLLGENGEPYNVGNDEEITILEAAKIAAKHLGSDKGVLYERSDDEDYLTDNPQRRCPNLNKVKKLGYEPRVSFADGFARTLDSYN